MKKGEIVFLMQLVSSLEEAEANLEQAYMRNDYENFGKAKKMIQEIQRKISGVVK